jgi:hypothetical protein
MCSTRSCFAVRTRSSTGPYGLRYSLWEARASGGKCRGSRSTPSACSNVLAEEVGRSVESGCLSRNSKDVSSSQLRRFTRSRVVTKWRLNPGWHGRGGWVAPLFGLLRAPEERLKPRLSGSGLLSTHFHGRPEAQPPNRRLRRTGLRLPLSRQPLGGTLMTWQLCGMR